jgi:hypothetical protein
MVSADIDGRPIDNAGYTGPEGELVAIDDGARVNRFSPLRPSLPGNLHSRDAT